MASIGAGYDLTVATFSPDGRVFQVEYAAKAISAASTALAMVCSNGILLAGEKKITTKLALPNVNNRIFPIDKHASIIVCGVLADCRQVVARARLEARQYKELYDELIPGHILAERIALFLHAYTLAWSYRPFGTGVLLAVIDDTTSHIRGVSLIDGIWTEAWKDPNVKRDMKPSLFAIDPSGSCYRYRATALGKGGQSAKTELEKLNLSSLTCEEAATEATRILRLSNETIKDEDFKVEIAVLSEQNNWTYVRYSPEELSKIETEAQRRINSADDEAM